MKKIMNVFVLVATVAMVLVSCQKNEIRTPEKQEVQFTINSGQKSKTLIEATVVDGKTVYKPSWDGNEKLGVLFSVPTGDTKVADLTIFENANEPGTLASFQGTATVNDNGTFYSFCPASAFARVYDAGDVRLDLKREQYPTATSFDPECDILVAKPYDYTVTDGQVKVDGLSFARIMSVLRINLKTDFADVQNEFVKSVSFTAGDVKITGYARIFLDKPHFTGNWESGDEYCTVTAKYKSDLVSIAGSANSVYVVVAPVTIPQGKELVFDIETTNYKITKEVTSPEMTFTAGEVEPINLTIKEENCELKPAEVSHTWNLAVDETSEVSEDVIAWESSIADMKSVRASSSNTAANNYYPGKDNRTSTRFYKGNSLVVTPKNGKTVTYVEFAATSEGYATDLVDSKWTNAIASAIEKIVYVVPEDGSKEFSAVISGTCGFTSVTVHTEELSATPLAMGEVTCIAQTSQSLTFSWDAVDGALGYKVSTDGGESYGEPQTSTTYNWTGLEPEKEYTLYVKAIGNAITISDSDPVSASGTTAEEDAAESVWALVKDASTLAAGDQIVIVASAFDKALGTTQNKNNRAAVGVTKSDDTVVIGNTVQIITLETGADGTYAFSTGSAGYLYAASSSDNHLKTKTELDKNGSWSITINASGVATIKANGTNTRNLLKYNSSSTLFSCYASGQSDVSIYRLGSGESGGEEPEQPEVPVTPELTVNPEVVEVSASGEDAEFEYTVTNPTEGVTVSASTEADWISDFSYVDSKVKFSVAENTATEAREATIELSYTGAEPKTVTVKQAAAENVEPEEPEEEMIEVTDVLTRTTTGVANTSYASWSGKTSNSSAVYAGQSAGGNSSIQLRSDKSNSGVITTASGGKVKKVTVTWNSNTASGRTLQVYGKSTAYSAPTDLYSSTTQGTLLGTIVNGTSTELVISGDYTFIGLRSASGAMYLTEIQITWETTSGSGGGTVVPDPTPEPEPEPEPEPTGNTFGKYSGTLTEGDYIIAYSGKAMKATISSNRFGYETVESVEIIENSDPSIVWHVEKNGDYWTIYNAAEGKYAAGTGTKNQGALVASGTGDESLWTVTGSATYEFVNKKNKSKSVNANLRNNGDYGFACYSTGTGGELTLYKKN